MLTTLVDPDLSKRFTDLYFACLKERKHCLQFAAISPNQFSESKLSQASDIGAGYKVPRKLLDEGLIALAILGSLNCHAMAFYTAEISMRGCFDCLLIRLASRESTDDENLSGRTQHNSIIVNLL